ncbi:MAG TPA: hypothetical protein VFT04_08395 [Gemmatimonadales bacterium]|nr:hypothetical protein [Gemmatimonadales bacterium]
MNAAARAIRSWDGIESRWSLHALLLAPLALVIGVVAYPNIQLDTMPMSGAIAMLGIASGLVVLSGRPRLFILLPLVATYLPSRQAGFAAYLLALAYFVAEYGGRRLTRRLDGFDFTLLAVLVWITASWLVNMGEQTDPWSLPVFLLTFLSPWLLLFVARAAPWQRAELHVIAGVWLALSASQLAPIFLKPLAVRELGAYLVPFDLFTIFGADLLTAIGLTNALDLTFGTTPSAHHLGTALLLTIVFLLALATALSRVRLVPLILVMTFAFLMTDSKHVILAALPAGMLFAALVFWPRLAPRNQQRARIVLLVLALVGGPLVAARTVDFVVNGVWRPYFALATLNPKLQLYMRSVELLGRNNLQTWIGHGPGSYATRAATIRATDVLYKEEQELPSFIPPHTGRAYRSVAYDLYTTEFVDAIRFQSGVLTSPFSSLVGIVAEFGILGTLVLGGMLGMVVRAGMMAWRRSDADPPLRAAGATAAFAIPFLVVLGCFDSYFEQPDVTAPMMIAGVIAMAVLDRRPARKPGAESVPEISAVG